MKVNDNTYQIKIKVIIRMMIIKKRNGNKNKDKK